MTKNRKNFVRAGRVPTDGEVDLAVKRMSPNWTCAVAPPRIGNSVRVGGPLMVCVDIHTFLLDVRVAVSATQKGIAAYCAIDAQCIPTIDRAEPDRLESLEVTCNEILHQNSPS
jgi:hypothetical protein